MFKRAVAILGVATVSMALMPAAKADPATPGSPLVGAHCSAGAAITGAGASFAKNAHQTVFIPAYNAACGLGSVTYSSVGSGAGKKAYIDRTHAFGMSDEPLSPDEQARGAADLGSDAANPNPRGRVSPGHHIPLALGAITVSYNLAVCGVGQETLNLRSTAVASIYTGLITRWNDAILVADNPILAACNVAIKPAARSDGSGTTYAFKDFLSKRNPQFVVYKQNDQNLNWPAQDLGLNTILRGNGNGGVAAAVKANSGAIGYVELSTAIASALTWAKVDGPHALFVSPRAGTAANCELAGLGATHPPSTLSPGWEAVSITDSPNPLAYPVCTFTYALVHNNLTTALSGVLGAAGRQTTVDYLNIAVDDIGQAQLPALGYAKLSPNMQAIAKAGLASVAAV